MKHRRSRSIVVQRKFIGVRQGSANKIIGILSKSRHRIFLFPVPGTPKLTALLFHMIEGGLLNIAQVWKSMSKCHLLKGELCLTPFENIYRCLYIFGTKGLIF